MVLHHPKRRSIRLEPPPARPETVCLRFARCFNKPMSQGRPPPATPSFVKPVEILLMSPAHAQTLVLNPGQTLSDQAPPLDGLRVILEADTGVGKTHYILHTVAAQTPLVLLLPTVNQVQQLAATYTQPADYVYGQSHPETLGPLIIATYDQADWIAQQLGPRCEDYALVIDEIHQLYQAGSYRACALMKLYALIDHLGTPGQFRQLIGLSATPNPDLFYFETDRWWRIDRTTTPERTFHLVEYRDPTLWLDWLTHERATVLNPAQLHMIRLNNVADLDTLEAYFSQLGYRVLTVHSRVQDTEAVQEMLASQEVNDKYNLLLTTSLIDEGINLMNTDVGSIHSIGTTTHLSEIRQCLGRFRRANPTVYLHLPTLTTDPVPTLDLIAEGNALVETCEVSSPRRL